MDTNFDYGETIYIEMAERCGVNPLKALINIESMLPPQWDHTEDFLEALGADDVDAIIEARSHFGLEVFE